MQTMAQIVVETGRSSSTQPDDNADTWKIGGWKLDSEDAIGGAAVCTPMSDFLMDPDGVTQVSSRGWAALNTPNGIDCDAHETTAEMWGGFAATYLSSFRGGFFNSHSRISIGAHTDDIEKPVLLHVENDTCGVWGFDATAYSFMAGVLNPARYLKRWVIGPNWDMYRKQVVAESHQHVIQTLAPTDQAICYLTDLGGEFDGNGESAMLRPAFSNGVESWVLDAKAGGGQVIAEAECMLYDQRTPPDSGSPL
jgi:hypothetical protein